MLNKRQILPIVVFSFVVFGLTFGGVITANAAVGTTGKLEIGSTSAFDGAIVAVNCYDLEVSASYKINATGDDTGFEFITGSGQTSYVVYLTVNKPSGSEACYIYLWGNQTLAALDSYTLQVKDESIIPDEFLIALGITLLVLFLIIGIVKRMRK